MEVTYVMELPEPISQMVFAEFKTLIEATIINAEALAIKTAGRLWWGLEDGKYFIDYEPDAYNMALAFKKALETRVQELVIEKGRKDITIDCFEVINKVLSDWREEEE